MPIKYLEEKINLNRHYHLLGLDDMYTAEKLVRIGRPLESMRVPVSAATTEHGLHHGAICARVFSTRIFFFCSDGKICIITLFCALYNVLFLAIRIILSKQSIRKESQVFGVLIVREVWVFLDTKNQNNKESV